MSSEVHFAEVYEVRIITLQYTCTVEQTSMATLAPLWLGVAIDLWCGATRL